MTHQKRVLIIGRKGQVASALASSTWPATIMPEHHARPILDLHNHESVSRIVLNGGYAAVINPAAYTKVDQAELEPDAAWALNCDAPQVLARACRLARIPLIHISTDYVFDGTKQKQYIEDDVVNPISVYGASKAAGEEAIRMSLDEHVIIRSSWIFSETGTNFVKSMLKAGQEQDILHVVNDQHGRPTAAEDIASAIIRILTALLQQKTDNYGTFHYANSGATTRHDFAHQIFSQAACYGYKYKPRIVSVSSDEYPARAKRPLHCILDTQHIEKVYGIKPRSWVAALSSVMNRLIGTKGIEIEKMLNTRPGKP